MKKYIRGFSGLVLGVAIIALSSCATCKTSYRRELSNDPKLREANTSYKKAIDWLDKAECSVVSAAPNEAERSYTTAESYLSDAIYKLEQEGHDNNIDVSEDIYYCEKMKKETDVKKGKIERATS